MKPKPTQIRTALFLTALTAATALTHPAHAQTQTFSGTTLGVATTFNRPEDNGTAVPDTLSSIGVSDYYSAQSFTVPTSGSYDILSTANSPANWDNFAVLYQNSFSSASPLTNVVLANDDYNLTTGLAGFDGVSLVAGVPYTLVTTGFSDDDSDQGSFTDTVTRSASGNMSAPEPAALLLLTTAIPGIALAARRRLAQ